MSSGSGTSQGQGTSVTTANKSEIDFSKLIPIQGDKTNYSVGRIIVETTSSSRRVDEKCEVRFFIQKYVCLKENGNLVIFNKDYKNPLKRSIDKMEQIEVQIRKCLLNLFDGQVAWFVLKKEADPKQFDLAMFVLKEEEDRTKYEDFLYYKFFVETILFPQPSEPTSIQLFDRYVAKYQEEIRYFIQKGLFKDGISWANSLYQRFFNMNNNLKKQMTSEIRKKLLPEMKTVLLNHSCCLLKKVNEVNKKKDYEELIDLVTNKYYKHFPEKDEKWFKISLRLVHSYMNLKEFEKCEETLKELGKLNPEDTTVKNMQQEIAILRNKNTNKPKKSIVDYFKTISNNDQDCDEKGYTWDTASECLDLSSNLDVAVVNILRN